MKYCFLITLFFAFASANAQSYNQWSVDGNLGLNSAMEPFAPGYQSNYMGLFHIDANARYMITNKFGIMGGMGFDRIKGDALGIYQSENSFTTHYIRLSFQSVFDLGRMADFHLMNERFSMLLHAGAGFSSLKDQKKSVWFKDWQTQGTDEMMHFIIGFTPQVRINNRVAIHLDFTYIANVWQTKTFDFTAPNEYRKGIDGKIMTFNLGMSWYFGSGGSDATHMDWVIGPESSSTVTASSKSNQKRDGGRNTGPAERQQNETKAEDSQDTPYDKRIEGYDPDEDIDQDGFLNKDDFCPTTPGVEPNGCPSADRDGDGIANSIDQCPDIKGIMGNSGCPGIDLKVRQIITEAMIHVDFEQGNDILLENAESYIDDVVDVLEQHPEYFMSLQGRTKHFNQ